MISKPTIVLLLTVAIVAAALGVAAGRHAASPSKAAVAPPPSDESVPVAAASPSPQATRAAPRGFARGAVEPDHPAGGVDANESLQQGIQTLEARFQAEPVAQGWAMEQERMISASFAPDALKAGAAPAPISHEARCRSSTCRITATYKTQMDAQIGQVNLLASISPTLQHAVMGEVPGADGSVQLVVYASPTRPGPLPPEAFRH